MSNLQLSVTDRQLERYQLQAARASLTVAAWVKSVLDEAPETLLFDVPYGAEDEPRDRQINLKLTATEHEHLKSCARDSEVTLSAYVRRSALRGRPPRPAPNKLTRDALRSLDYIGHNLNQIARRLNAAHRGSLPATSLPTRSEISAALKALETWALEHGG